MHEEPAKAVDINNLVFCQTNDEIFVSKGLETIAKTVEWSSMC
jgi:hypothetical protein